jgi:hypothetical protein
MGIKTRTIWVPREDQHLVGVNSFTRGLKASQFVSMDPQPAGKLQRQFNITYEAEEPPKLVSSSIIEGTTLHKDYLPASIILLFSTDVDKNIQNGDFTWYLSTGTTSVAANTVTFSGSEVTVPLPSMGTYQGTVTLIGKGLRSQEGVPMTSALNLSFQSLDVDKFPTSEAAKNYTEDDGTRQGKLNISRLVVPHSSGTPEQMIQAFKSQYQLADNQVLDVVHRGGEIAGYTDVYVAWFPELGPRPVNVSPRPGISLPSENPPARILLSFDTPVESLTTSDAVLTGPVVSYTVEQVSTDKTQWALVLTTVTAGHLVLKLNVPDRNGQKVAPVRLYSWHVMPRTVAGSGPGGSNTPFCDSYTGDGILDDFTLSHAPLACSYHVFVNGVSMLSCVSVVGTTLTFLDGPPFVGAQIVFRGWY